MPERFFLPDDPGPSPVAVIEGPLAHHIARSLRMRPGDSLLAVDPRGREHHVRLRTVSAGRVEGDITWSRPATGEPRLRITVIQALPRERMDDCIDILVEAGAAEVRPVVTERVVSRPSGDRVAHRLHRWQTVAQESAQLAGRGMIPHVHAPVPLADALAALPPGSRIVACTADSATPLATLEIDATTPLALCIGPEGSFGPRDLQTLRDHAAETVHLGPRILRTRYAGAFACALLLARAGDLGHERATDPPS